MFHIFANNTEKEWIKLVYLHKSSEFCHIVFNFVFVLKNWQLGVTNYQFRAFVAKSFHGISGKILENFGNFWQTFFHYILKLLFQTHVLKTLWNNCRNHSCILKIDLIRSILRTVNIGMRRKLSSSRFSLIKPGISPSLQDFKSKSGSPTCLGNTQVKVGEGVSFCSKFCIQLWIVYNCEPFCQSTTIIHHHENRCWKQLKGHYLSSDILREINIRTSVIIL